MKNPLLEKIEELLAGAKPEDVAGIKSLENIRDELSKKAAAQAKVKQDLLVEVCKVWGMDGDRVRDWEGFSVIYLQRCGYKTISKRRVGGRKNGGVRKSNTVPITEEIVEQAKKLYQQSKWKDDVRGLAKHLTVNGNSLKKALNIPKSFKQNSAISSRE